MGSLSEDQEQENVLAACRQCVSDSGYAKPGGRVPCVCFGAGPCCNIRVYGSGELAGPGPA
jgi:hypothetical protein